MSELMMICRLSYFLTEFVRELFQMNERVYVVKWKMPMV